MLRVDPAGVDALVRHGPLTLDLQRYKLLFDDRTELLTPSRMRVIEALMRQPSNVHSLQALFVTMGGKVGSFGRSAQGLRLALARLLAAPRLRSEAFVLGPRDRVHLRSVTLAAILIRARWGRSRLPSPTPKLP